MGETIRIIATPPGQAPESIREQWVGLELPVLEDRQEPSVQEGARGGKPENLGGYQIDAEVALLALHERSPRAAKWWLDHAPMAFLPASRLVFARGACEVIPDAPESPVIK